MHNILQWLTELISRAKADVSVHQYCIRSNYIHLSEDVIVVSLVHFHFRDQEGNCNSVRTLN